MGRVKEAMLFMDAYEQINFLEKGYDMLDPAWGNESTTEKPMKLCWDCKYCIGSIPTRCCNQSVIDKDSHALAMVVPLTDCVVARQNEDLCGISGKYWRKE